MLSAERRIETHSDEVLVGVISDTHGLLRQEAFDALRGSHIIIHAGDIGDPQILNRLLEIAPVYAVRGNVDKGPWARDLPEILVAECAGKSFYVLHDVKELNLDPATAGFHAVISGHSHKPSIDQKRGVLFLNPGSAGPRRFSLPVTVARIRVCGERMNAEIVSAC